MPPARRLRQDELFYDPVKVENEDSDQRVNNAQDHRSETGIWKEAAEKISVQEVWKCCFMEKIRGYPSLIVVLWHAYISED